MPRTDFNSDDTRYCGARHEFIKDSTKDVTLNFEEHAAKPLLRAAGIQTPAGQVTNTPVGARRAAEALGPVVVKAQVPTGKRGKAGGIKTADTPAEAEAIAKNILGMEINGYLVEQVLVEQQCNIRAEYYAAVLNDPASKCPLLMFSSQGGMDIEEIAAKHPRALATLTLDIRHPFDLPAALQMLETVDDVVPKDAVAKFLTQLYQTYLDTDAELLEVNPLVLTGDDQIMALDCKFVLDDSAIKRRQELSRLGVAERLSDMETKAAQLGFKYIDLDGEIGVLANGAGLTMTTMDVVRHYGAKPANFLEIGGDAYTLAEPALSLLLTNTRVRSLVVNFCGAFARTDVMVQGVVSAWKSLKPDIPIFFSVHGTGEEQAVAMLRAELDIEPFETMDEAVRAAIAAAGGEA